MIRKVMMAAMVAALVSMGCAATETEEGADAPEVEATPIDAGAVIAAASEAMGVNDLDSIMYSGTAYNIGFGQTQNINGPYDGMGIDVDEYVRTIDLNMAAPRSYATGATFAPFRGGPPQAGRYNMNVTSESGWAQQMEIWLTPWGFLKGAAANNATGTREARGDNMFNIVRWSPSSPTSQSGEQYEIWGFIDDDNMIVGIESWVEDAVAGDLEVQQRFEDYQEFDGVMVPTTMFQNRMGRETFRATITDATIHPADLEAQFAAAPAGRGGGGGGGGAPPPVEAEELGPGVYRITQGYESLAVEFDDYIAIFEGGQSEARGLAVIEATRNAIPGKEIRYVVNSHPHFDHAGGLAPFVAEGITILTHENNVEFLAEALGNPRTLVGDTLNAAMTEPTVEGVGDLLVLEDGTGATLELHYVQGNDHTDGMLVAYVPEVDGGLLFQADFTLPAPGDDPNPYVVALADNVARLGLEFNRYYAVHASQNPETYQDLMAHVSQ